MRGRDGAFLAGLALASCAVLAGCAEPVEVSEERLVMGDRFSIETHDPDPERAGRALSEAFAEAERLDRLLTTYDAASQVSELNRGAGRSWVRVDPQVMELLERSLEWSELTGGAFDPTIGPVLRAWGIPDKSGPGIYPPLRRDMDAILLRVGPKHVLIDERSASVKLDRGSELDFGAIGKGYAVDRVVAILQEAGVPSARVDAAGNLRVYGEPPGGGLWRVPIRHPRDPEGTLATLEVGAGAVATSTDYAKQIWVPALKRYLPTVVDPRTGEPVEGVASVTVQADTAEEADVLSTAVFVLGYPDGLRLAVERGVEAVIVLYDEENVSVLTVHTTPGLADLEITL